MASALWRISRLVGRPQSRGALQRLQFQPADTRAVQTTPVHQTSPLVQLVPAVPPRRSLSTEVKPRVSRTVGVSIPRNLIHETKLLSLTQQQLEALARHLAEDVKPADVILLQGDLGAGKSTFARAFVREITGDAALDVTSPTYVIEQVYEATEGYGVHHMDLYRLDGPNDFQKLGLDKSFASGVCLVEWPDRLGRFVPQQRLDVEVRYADADDVRHVRLRAVGGQWAERVARAIELASLSLPLALGAQALALEHVSTLRA